MAVSLKVNGAVHSVPAEPDTPLLYVLRNDLGLNAAKFGCGLGQCGACTVLVDGAPVRSCVTPIGALAQSEITTLEGLGTLERPHPLQAAFIAGAGGAVRLLHRRHHHVRQSAARPHPAAERGGGPAGTCRQSVPLRGP